MLSKSRFILSKFLRKMKKKIIFLISFASYMKLQCLSFLLAFVVIQCSVFVVTRSLMLKIKMGKRNDLSLQENKKLIQKYDVLPKTSQRDAASKLKISQPFLCKLLRDREKITKSIQKNDLRNFT